MPHALDPTKPGADTDRLATQYLAFLLQGQVYGLDILRIREIVGTRRIIPVTTTTPYLRGLIKLSGGILPVVDLRESPPPLPDELSQETSTIIALVSGMQLAILIDKVLDVCDVCDHDIRRTVPPDACVSRRFITGVARVKDGDMILLDISEVLTQDDFKTVWASVDGKS